MPAMEPYRRIAHDELIGREVVATVARGFNSRGGGMFTVHNQRGQVWSAADPTMIGSRRECVYWIADGAHYYAAAESDIELASSEELAS